MLAHGTCWVYPSVCLYVVWSSVRFILTDQIATYYSYIILAGHQKTIIVLQSLLYNKLHLSDNWSFPGSRVSHCVTTSQPSGMHTLPAVSKSSIQKQSEFGVSPSVLRGREEKRKRHRVRERERESPLEYNWFSHFLFGCNMNQYNEKIQRANLLLNPFHQGGGIPQHH